MSLRTIIRLPNWLGDAVMASPAVYRYAEDHPDEDITLFGIPLTLAVFENSPYPFQFIRFDRDNVHKGFRGILSISQEIRSRHFDKGYLFTHSFSSVLIFMLGGVKERIGYRSSQQKFLNHRNLDSPIEARHQAQRYMYLMNSPSLSIGIPNIYVNNNEEGFAQAWISNHCQGKKLVGMAPGAAYGTAKRWFPERYAEVAKCCVERLNANVLVFGNDKERDTVEWIAEKAGDGCISCAGEVNLRQFFALMQKCKVLVCNDSGAMHVATAVGTPVIALFGPTNQVDTHPLGDGNILIDKHVDCAPCLEHECPYEHHKCMVEISVEEVFDRLDIYIH